MADRQADPPDAHRLKEIAARAAKARSSTHVPSLPMWDDVETLLALVQGMREREEQITEALKVAAREAAGGNERTYERLTETLWKNAGAIYGSDGSLIGSKDMSDRDFLAPFLDTAPALAVDGETTA